MKIENLLDVLSESEQLRSRSRSRKEGARMNIKYQVGHLTKIDPANPELSSGTAAIELAISESRRDQTSPYGIWTGQDSGSELVAMAYQGQLFRAN